MAMIRNCTFKGCIPTIVSELKASKSKMVRENCLEYMNEILLNWEMLEKDVDPFEEAIKLGLEEASVRGREVARIAYLNFRALFPKRADRVKAKVSSALQAKLTKAEAEYSPELLPPTPAPTPKQNLKSPEMKPSRVSVIRSFYLNTIPTNPNCNLKAVKNPLRSPKPSTTSTAVTSIQAFVRGNMMRRKSMQLSVSSDAQDKQGFWIFSFIYFSSP